MPRPGVLCGNARLAVLAEPPWRSEDDVASVWADDGGVPAASAQDRERVGRVPGRCPGTQTRGCGVLECGWRQMTRVVCDVGQPHRMETCGVEEPYEGNLHVRFCGGIGRVIADPTRTADRLQRPLRSRFQRRLTPGVRPCGREEPPKTGRSHHYRTTGTDQHRDDRRPTTKTGQDHSATAVPVPTACPPSRSARRASPGVCGHG